MFGWSEERIKSEFNDAKSYSKSTRGQIKELGNMRMFFNPLRDLLDKEPTATKALAKALNITVEEFANACVTALKNIEIEYAKDKIAQLEK